jgi:hypothetical protein
MKVIPSDQAVLIHQFLTWAAGLIEVPLTPARSR